MSWTDADATALRKAIAQGVRAVEYDTQRVEYRSLDEMLRTLALMERELGYRPARGGPFTFATSKGLK